MVEAARAALHYWQRCGTWLEEQRAEYRLASSLLLAGAHSDSKASASRCIELCRRHGAPPFEQFFGHAILALAQRAAGDQAAFAESRNEARAAYANVEPADQRWCATHLAELGPTEGYANA